MNPARPSCPAVGRAFPLCAGSKTTSRARGNAGLRALGREPRSRGASSGPPPPYTAKRSGTSVRVSPRGGQGTRQRRSCMPPAPRWPTRRPTGALLPARRHSSRRFGPSKCPRDTGIARRTPVAMNDARHDRADVDRRRLALIAYADALGEASWRTQVDEAQRTPPSGSSWAMLRLSADLPCLFQSVTWCPPPRR